MRDHSVSDVDGEIIGRIASASLRHENEVPGTVVRRAGLRDGNEGKKAARGRRISEKLFHYLLQSCRHGPRCEARNEICLASLPLIPVSPKDQRTLFPRRAKIAAFAVR
jgi:hypothetical protein